MNQKGFLPNNLVSVLREFQSTLSSYLPSSKRSCALPESTDSVLEAITYQADNVTIVVNSTGRIVYATEAALSFWCLSREAMLGSNIRNIVPPDIYSNALNLPVSQVLSGQQSVRAICADFRSSRFHPDPKNLDLFLSSWVDRSATVVGFVLRIEEQSESRRQFLRAIDRYPGAFGLVDRSLKVIAFNHHFSDMYQQLGACIKEGQPVQELFEQVARSEGFVEANGKGKEWVSARIRALQVPTEPYEVERNDCWYRVEYLHLPDQSCLITMTDISDYKSVEFELRESEKRFRDIAETAADWFWECDSENKLCYVSERFVGAHGILGEELIGEHYSRFLSPFVEWNSQLADLNDAIANNERFHNIILSVPGTESDVKHLTISGKPIFGVNGAFQGYRGTCQDVTTAWELESKLTFQAYHDKLTGLPNRAKFESELQQLLGDTKNLNDNWYLGYLDLDQFKVVNDTAGHSAGDRLLVEITKILKQILQTPDVVARLGGDEFGLLFQRSSQKELDSLTDNIIRKLDEHIFEWGEHQFSVNASIGLVAITADKNEQDELLACADIACYAAKDMGRGQAQLYHESNDNQAQRMEDVRIAAGIRKAIEDDLFVLYAQPIVKVDNNKSALSHFEILVRMLDGEGNIVPPDSFIPGAERFGLMGRVDRWVVENSLKMLGQVLSGRDDIGITINLSGQSVSDPTLAAYVEKLLREGNIAPGRVAFELTETAAIQNIEHATKFMKSVKSLGCRIALDDFGAGMSSFAYIKNFPVDYIKIDGSFIKNIHLDSTDRAMVSAIHQMARALGKKTIAEFVENDRILDELITLGVDYAQGYGIGRPVPFESSMQAGFANLSGDQNKAA